MIKCEYTRAVLKSGSPVMTIVGFTNPIKDVIECLWFNKNNELQEGIFNINCVNMGNFLNEG